MNRVSLGAASGESSEECAKRDGRIHRPSPAVAFVGRHNSGKTTLLVRVIAELVSRGFDIGSIKHHGHCDFMSRTFTGFRRFGDAAQDAIMDRLYDLDNRKVKFIECYDNLGSGKPNGRQGEGVLSITDDGSGDAQNRENISFGLKILGTPQKGTVTIGEDGTPTFSPQAAEAKAASK